MTKNNETNSTKNALKNNDVQFAGALLAIFVMMFIPLPPVVLDILLSFSITFGFLILLIAIYIREPLQFSTFPTLLLLTTLARLSLNVATTRNILLDGASGGVSQIVTAFGNFVVGGDYIVGFVIFLILVIINFLVITKGAGRVAEVGARFTLDAMPGKQMSIDADLNAGIIDRSEAKIRREKIEREADFYGSMDGASKFVRGDAIASIIITGINIIVGLSIGVFSHNMSIGQAAQVYTLLTVGDGLVSQMPAIIISVAAGIVVTRAGSEGRLSNKLSEQMFLNSKALYICASLLGILAVLPGLPTTTLFLLSVVFIFLGQYATKTMRQKDAHNKSLKTKEAESENKAESIENLLHVDTLALEVGVGLIPLVDKEQNGEILERIISSRKQFAQDMGVIVPMIMVRDNIQLKPGQYQILLKGNIVAKGDIVIDHELAMAPDGETEDLPGIKTKEPAYQLDAVWIKKSLKEEATFKGFTVVNSSTVIVTHLSKTIQDHCHELIGRQETQKLIERLKRNYPKVVEETLSPEGLTLGNIVKVTQLLLKEGVSIRDFLSIFETLADLSRTTKNPETLARHVRRTLGRSIVKKITSSDGQLSVATLEKSLEDIISAQLKVSEDGSSKLELDPETAQKFLNKVIESLSKFNELGNIPTLLCGPQIRWNIKKLLDRFIPGINVLSFDEVPGDIETKHIATISFS